MNYKSRSVYNVINVNIHFLHYTEVCNVSELSIVTAAKSVEIKSDSLKR